MIWQEVLSELFINMSAGWFGAALILPMTISKLRVNLRLLLINILCGILSLAIAVLLRN